MRGESEVHAWMHSRKERLIKELIEFSSACGVDVACVALERGENGERRPWLEFSSSPERDVMMLVEEFKASSSGVHEKHPKTTNNSRKRTHEDTAATNVHPSVVVNAILPNRPPEQLPQAGFLSSQNYPVSPRSDRAYQDLTAQFDLWIDQLSTGGGGGGGGGGGRAGGNASTAEGSMRLQGQAQSKGLLINLPHQRPHQPILQQATSFPLNLPYTSHPTSLLPPPAPLMVNEPSSNSGGKSSPSNSLLLGEGNVFGSSSLPSPNAHNLLDFGMFSSSSLGRQSIGILGLDLPLPSADSASNHHRDENQGKSEVQWPGQDDEGNDDGDDECGSRPAIELVVEGRAIDLEKERIIAAAEADLQPPEASAPSFLAPPPLLPPSSDLGGSLMLGMGISGVAVNSGSEPSDKALSSPTVPFPGFSS